MDTLEIYSALRNVPTFAGVFQSNLLPSHPLPGLVKYTVILNTDVHTKPSSHWDAIHMDTRSSSGYYFDSYGFFPLVPAIRHFLRRGCSLWSYNTRTLQGFTTELCGQYACLFPLFIDLDWTLASLTTCLGRRSQIFRRKQLSGRSSGHALAAASEAGSAAGKVSVSLFSFNQSFSRVGKRSTTNSTIGLFICYNNIRRSRATAQVSSLREMPNGKNPKRLVAQQRHRQVPRQAPGSQQQPPPEGVLLRRLYFLNPERYKYVCLCFYQGRSHWAFFDLGFSRQASLILPPTIVPTLVLHMPKLCEHLARGERY